MTEAEGFGMSEEDQEPSNETLEQMRRQIDDLSRELKRERKEGESLRTFKSAWEQEQRETKARTAFKDAGLHERWADLYMKVNTEAEVTPEAIQSFAAEYSLTPAPAPEAPEVPTGSPEQAFRQAFVQPTVQGVPPGQPKISLKEWEEQFKANPDRALDLSETLSTPLKDHYRR
jgi:hypothetical protein